MLILAIGAKGGLGTTSLVLALALARAGDAVGLDLSDGQLAARLGREARLLSRPAFASKAQRRRAVDEVVKRRLTLLWTPECLLKPDAAWGFVRAVADRAVVVADGGIEPPEGIAALADEIVIVSAGPDEESGAADPVVVWHERRLRNRFPDVLTATNDEESVRELAERLFGS